MNCETGNYRNGLFCDLDRGLNRIVRQAFRPVQVVAGFPPVAVNELEDRFQIECDLPGRTPAEIEVEFEEGVLAISAERKKPECAENQSLLVDERHYAKVVRRIQLAGEVQSDGIDAEYINGVLKITVPKAQQTQSKKISIRTKADS